MDPSLLRERELFKKRALSTPAVEKRPTSSDSGSHKKKKPKVDKESSSGSKVGAGKTCRTCNMISIHFRRVLSQTPLLVVAAAFQQEKIKAFL